MDDWGDYFYGEEAVRTQEEFNRREEMYQAFKQRFLEETQVTES